jgi:hypothetical protein
MYVMAKYKLRRLDTWGTSMRALAFPPNYLPKSLKKDIPRPKTNSPSLLSASKKGPWFVFFRWVFHFKLDAFRTNSLYHRHLNCMETYNHRMPDHSITVNVETSICVRRWAARRSSWQSPSCPWCRARWHGRTRRPQPRCQKPGTNIRILSISFSRQKFRNAVHNE